MNLKWTGLIILTGMIVLNSSSIYAQEEQVSETSSIRVEFDPDRGVIITDDQGNPVGNVNTHIEVLEKL